MKVLSTITMNRRVNDDVFSYIMSSEGDYFRQLAETAMSLIKHEKEKPIILLSGPSGSGKTTTAFRLKGLLRDLGVKTYALSMDNYFLTVDDPRNEREPDGSIDFESPKRLDMDLLDEHLDKLFNGEEFTLPVFDFANQRQLKGKQFRRKEHEMVIIEGIHSLNPAVTGRVSEHAAGVYVSVRTRMKRESGELIHPSKIRLMRRLVRDKLFRGREAAQTLEFFEKVQLGEKKYILPHKCYAEHNIDTFIAYEAAAYKNFLTEELTALRDSNYEGFEKYEDMLLILDELVGVDLTPVPSTSLVREFAGGSSFEY
ncbi:MAG: nucleoside kinase [Oscillospiraceae bacterium]|nr:nucleoside kinase [Oscillospiraceae bacterium]